MKGLIDKSKAAVSGLGDKMKLTAASRAPQENDGFKELVGTLFFFFFLFVCFFFFFSFFAHFFPQSSAKSISIRCTTWKKS